MNETSVLDLPQDSHMNQINVVLQGESDRTKVKVYQLVHELNLDPEDPIFIFAMVLGHVRVLVDSEPIKIKQLFNTFNREIETWTKQNVQTLEKIAHKAELSERIADNTKILNDLLKELLTATATLIEPLQKSSANSLNSISQLKTSLIRLENLMQSLLEENQNLARSSQELAARLSNPQLFKNSPNSRLKKPKKPKWITNLILLVLSLNFLLGAFLLSLSLQTKQEVKWLLQKANRQECLAGIKKPDSPECAGLI